MQTQYIVKSSNHSLARSSNQFKLIFFHSLTLKFLNETTVDNAFDTETGMSSTQSDFVLLGNEINDPTGGRHPPIQETLIKTSAELLNSLAEGLEKDDIHFNEPYDSTVSEIIRLLSQMDLESLQKLYTEVDIGTSYRQETIRNIFYEIIPRIGTKASVQLTKELIMVKQIKSTTAVQLLILLPFHIYELSHDLVKECESFLTLGKLTVFLLLLGFQFLLLFFLYFLVQIYSSRNENMFPFSCLTTHK